MNKISPTINTYNLYDGVYDEETKEFWSNFPKTTVDLFSKDLPGKKILNLGSGAGRDSLILRDRGLDVTCVDASIKMVERTVGLGFHTILSDFRKIEMGISNYDGIWAYTSLLHIKKEEVNVVLKKIHDALKSNGIFLIGMIEGNFEGNMVRESMPDTYRYFRFYEEEELKTLVKHAGFKFKEQKRYKPHNNVYLSQIYMKKPVFT